MCLYNFRVGLGALTDGELRSGSVLIQFLTEFGFPY